MHDPGGPNRQHLERAGRLPPYSILVSGATGFIGSRLIAELAAGGVTARGLSRKKIPDTAKTRYVQADVFDPGQLDGAMRGVRVAFYLLHSMEGEKGAWQEFASRERVQAQNFLEAATKAGVEQIIYLGGLVSDGPHLSPHMRSRKEVGRILASGSIPVTELRASLIIGAQGGSYAMLRYLVERLRIMVCPSWVRSAAQPIAVDDVITYLVGCISNEKALGRVFEIGGPEQVTYEQLMRTYSAYLNKKLFVLQIPFLTTRLSSYWVDLITPVKASLARPLIDSLVHDTVVTDDSITKIIPVKPKSVREAIADATKEMAESPPAPEREGRSGFGINQRIVQISLVLLGICGTTYYWLDGRPEVYQPLWILGSVVWYCTIAASILFVHNKTRLGYLMAGVLSWATMAFWLFDNYYVVFETSVIASQPSHVMTVRNFVGIAVAAVAVVSSHNLFHKVLGYQYRGRPI